MAYAYPQNRANNLHGEIIPTEIMIKSIPIHWKTDCMLHLMSQMKLPLPSVLKYLYDDSHVFRGMAFATFTSLDESRHVVQELNHHWVCGQMLNVQFKRKRPETFARDGVFRGRLSQPYHYSQTIIAEKAHLRPQMKRSPASTPRREQTPDSESYNLLMSYQNNPAEKDKLKKFLVQTRNYQEAVNEFAKNRAKETQEGLHGDCMENSPILEMRPPTPGEQEQIDEMESRFGVGSRASWSELLITQRGGDHHAIKGTKGGTLESVNLNSLQKGQEHETTSGQRVRERDF